MSISANKWPKFIEVFVPAVTGGIAALILWPLSYAAANSTAWLSVGTFLDFWLGAFAVISGVAALAATVVAVISSAFTAWVLCD